MSRRPGGAGAVSAPPKTRLHVTPEEAHAVRAAVIAADPSGLGADCTAASEKDAQALTHLLADPSIATAIYDLPSPITLQTVGAWIADAETKRRRGEALLTIRTATDATIYSYSYFTIWPDLAAAEIAGGFRTERQDAGLGKTGALRSFAWMFEAFKVRLICVTAALDNVRSARVIEAAGFTSMGERQSRRADGSERRSRYWEMTIEQWRKLDLNA